MKGAACEPGTTVAADAPEKAGENEITTDALKALLASGEKPVLLDARTGKFDDGKRIPGAGGLPRNVLRVFPDQACHGSLWFKYHSR